MIKLFMATTTLAACGLKPAACLSRAAAACCLLGLGTAAGCCRLPPGAALMAATSDPYPEGAPPGHIVLYGNPTSRVCKVLWVCAELGVPVISVPVWEQRKEPWFTQLNPKQAVPVVRDGDLLLHESNTIVTYLAAKYGRPAAPPSTTTSKVTHPDGTSVEVTTTTTGSASGDGADSLLPAGPEATAVASMWTEYAETTIAPKQNPIFFGKVRLGPIGAQPAASGAPAEKRPGCPSDEALLEHVPGLVRAWTAFEEALEGKLYVTGDAFTIGDICAAVQANRFIRNHGFGYPQLAPENFPNVLAWFGRISARPAFAEHVGTRFK